MHAHCAPNQLVTVIGSAAAKYREAIILRDIDGYLIGEMTEALRLSHAAVKNRIRRRREMPREYLRD